ncbi:MAG: TlyA family RNA methyltransferase [bacterium]
MKYRLDEILVIRKMIDSRIKAYKMIVDGKVKVENQIVYKPSKKFPLNVNIEIEPLPEMEFVSRGGYKLKEAIEKFNIDVKNKVCMDIGASTGGFTDCLLKYGAKKVIAIDNGKNQLHPSLLKNPNVINIENFNAKNINLFFQNNSLSKEIEIIAIDVSFISVTLITESLAKVKNEKKLNLIILIKPNFEINKDERKFLKKGVLKDRKKLILITLRTLKKIRNQGFKFIKIIPSPIKGDKGNTEFLAYFIKEKL